jgi:PAS domain S-box-containing protein
VETAPEGIWVTDREGMIRFANPRMAALPGVEVEDLAGQRIEDIILPENLISERIRLRNPREGYESSLTGDSGWQDGTEV